MCILFKVTGSKIGIFKRNISKAEEGEHPMDKENQLRDPAAPKNQSSYYVLFIRLMHCLTLQT